MHRRAGIRQTATVVSPDIFFYNNLHHKQVSDGTLDGDYLILRNSESWGIVSMYSNDRSLGNAVKTVSVCLLVGRSVIISCQETLGFVCITVATVMALRDFGPYWIIFTTMCFLLQTPLSLGIGTVCEL
jgi:hypothetical protein